MGELLHLPLRHTAETGRLTSANVEKIDAATGALEDLLARVRLLRDSYARAVMDLEAFRKAIEEQTW